MLSSSLLCYHFIIESPLFPVKINKSQHVFGIFIWASKSHFISPAFAGRCLLHPSPCFSPGLWSLRCAEPAGDGPGLPASKAVQHHGEELLLAVAFREWCEGNTLFFTSYQEGEKRIRFMSLVLLNLLLITCVTTKKYINIYIFFFFPPRSKDTSMFIALQTHLIYLKSFVYRNIAGNTEKRRICCYLQRLES